jgi:hypothetical protein
MITAVSFLTRFPRENAMARTIVERFGSVERALDNAMRQDVVDAAPAAVDVFEHG